MMPKSRDKFRLFIAAFPPEEIRRQMLNLIDGLELPHHRATPLEQVHLTVHFVGSVMPKEVASITVSIAHAIRRIGTPEVDPMKLIALPSKGPARLIALQCKASPALLELNRRLVTRLADTARNDRFKGYLPHFTLCRFEAPREIEAPNSRVSLRAMQVDEIRLMRSKLTTEGVYYEALEIFPLAL